MSASPGYILPTTSVGFPGHLTLGQFLQTVLVGVSGLPGPLVRPEWQQEEPQQPDINTDWLAFGITTVSKDANAFVGTDGEGVTTLIRQEALEISCAIYGPNALENAGLIQDGFQVQTNLEAMRAANMGYGGVGPIAHVPELINERWFDRVQMSIYLRRQVQRVYAVPTILSASGTIHTVVGNEEYLLPWAT